MTELVWNAMGGDVLIAHGTDWTYLIAQDARDVVLTRWELQSGSAVVGMVRLAARDAAVARQAALHAIRLPGALGISPEAAAMTAGYLKRAAQAYEAGIDIDGEAAWHHGYQGKASG